MNSIGSVIGFHVPMCQVNKIGFQMVVNIYTKIWHSIMIKHIITLLEEL